MTLFFIFRFVALPYFLPLPVYHRSFVSRQLRGLRFTASSRPFVSRQLVPDSSFCHFLHPQRCGAHNSDSSVRDGVPDAIIRAASPALVGMLVVFLYLVWVAETPSDSMLGSSFHIFRSVTLSSPFFHVSTGYSLSPPPFYRL